MNEMKTNGVSVVLGSYNRKPFLKQTVASIRTELLFVTFPSEIIVIDGGSTDGTLQWLMKQKDIITIIQHNKGKWNGRDIDRKSWGYFMNLGFKIAQGKFICMLSDDCLIVPGAINNGYTLFETKLRNNENIGAVAFYWRNWPKQKKFHILKYWNKTNVNHGLYLREALQKVGFADESTFTFYWGDVDIVFKLVSHEYSIIAAENSFIEHFNHANISLRRSNLKSMDSDRIKFITKWSQFFPSINLNLCDDVAPVSIEYEDTTKTANQWLLNPIVLLMLCRRVLIDNIPRFILERLVT